MASKNVQNDDDFFGTGSNPVLENPEDTINFSNGDDLVIDFSIDPSLITPGKYLARAKKIEYKTSQNGNKMFNFQYNIVSDGTESNKAVWHTITLTPNNMANVRRMLIVYGATPEELAAWKTTINDKGIATNRIFLEPPLVALTIEHRKNEQNGEMQNSVKRLDPASSMPREDVLGD